MRLYVAGRLRDPYVRDVAAALRGAGHEVFDDWHSAHPDADDIWRDYERQRGRSYADVVRGDSEMRNQVREFDLGHLNEAEGVVIVGNLSTSTSIEMGYIQGRNSIAYPKRQHIFWLLREEPERWDFMTAGNVVYGLAELVEAIAKAGA